MKINSMEQFKKELSKFGFDVVIAVLSGRIIVLRGGNEICSIRSDGSDVSWYGVHDYALHNKVLDFMEELKHEN